MAAALLPAAVAANPNEVPIQLSAVDRGHKPIAGARFLVTPLWSSDKDVQVHGRAVGRTVLADGHGKASMRLVLSAAERASAHANGDWLNVSIVAIDAKGNPVAFRTTTQYLGTKPDQIAEQAWLPDPASVDMQATSDVATAGSGDASSSLVSCTYYWEQYSTQDRYAQYGELNVDKDVLTAQITYGTSADSSFDVDTKGTDGTWTITGSIHVGNGHSSATGTDAGGQTNYHWALRTLFRYVDSRLYKDCVGGPYHAWTGAEEIDAQSWLGGGSTQSNTVTQGAWTSTKSYTYGPGGTYHREQYQFVKWSAGAGAYLQSFGIQSGSSQYVKYDYKFGYAKSVHYLYGDTDYPRSSKRVFQLTP